MKRTVHINGRAVELPLSIVGDTELLRRIRDCIHDVIIEYGGNETCAVKVADYDDFPRLSEVKQAERFCVRCQFCAQTYIDDLPICGVRQCPICSMAMERIPR